MKFTAIAAATAVIFGTVDAQIQSKPFHLVLSSKTKSLNGLALRGVTTQGNLAFLALGPKYKQNNNAAQTFRWNTTTDQPHTGILTRETTVLPNNEKVQQVMDFQINAATNVAFPLFTFASTGQNVHFDGQNRMFVEGFIDDHNSGKKDTGTRHYRWQVCKFDELFGATAVGWTLGKYPAQNPSCKAVTIRRVFNS